MKPGLIVAPVVVGVILFAAGVGAAQRGWVLSLRKTGPAAHSGILRPQASIGTTANGIYCTSPAENGVGIHDIGAIPSGIHVIVIVESYTDGFNPVAGVVVATLGQKAANTVKLASFYDNDSGGNSDAKIDFVTPQEGNYLLIVGDYTDAIAGCYRYQVVAG
jgi:hypothetical protein